MLRLSLFFLRSFYPVISTVEGEAVGSDIGNIIDPGQNHTLTLLPGLVKTVGPDSEVREAGIQPFLAARATAGLMVPVYECGAAKAAAFNFSFFQ